MSSQQPGMSQPQSRQQAGPNDFQLLQQHLMYKQIQELQRRQQVHQLNQVSRQQNTAGQLSSGAKQATLECLPTLLNGMPVSSASSYMRQNEFSGGEPKTLSSSHMFAGNLNWVQSSGSAMYGLPNAPFFSNDQGQVIRSMGLAPHQLDQSLYGTPVSNTGVSLNQYANFQGMVNASNDVMEGGSRNSSQRDQPVFAEQGHTQDGAMFAKQGFQGNDLFVNAPNQNQISGITPENIHQVVQQLPSFCGQEFQNVRGQSDWSESMQEKVVVPAGASHGASRLDPTEEKLLFGNADDANWDTSFGRNSNSAREYMHGNSLGDNNYSGTFPSVQSGSWSALMLDALDASSSETGVHEEWSGLSSQKLELSAGNHSALLNDSAKQQSWNDSNVQNASSSRSFALFHESEASPSCHTAPNLQPSNTRFIYEHNDQVLANTRNESYHQMPKDIEAKHFDRRCLKQFVEGGLQAQMQSDNSPTSAWMGHAYEQLVNTAHPSGMKLNPSSSNGIWADQQSMSSPNLRGQTGDKLDGWPMNDPVATSMNDRLAFHADNGRQWRAHKGDMNGEIHTETDHNCGMQKSAENAVDLTGGLESQDSYLSTLPAASNSRTLPINQEINQQEYNIHKVNMGRHVSVHSNVKSKGAEVAGIFQHQPGNGLQPWDSTIKNVNRGLTESSNHNQEFSIPKAGSKEGCFPGRSNSGQLTDNRSVSRENPFFAGNGLHHLVSSNQKAGGLPAQQSIGLRKFQYHPMGNRMKMESAEALGPTSYPQGGGQFQGLNNQDQSHHGESQFTNTIANNTMIVSKRQASDFQNNAKDQEQAPSRSSIPYQDPTLDGKTAYWAHHKQMGQASQNMLELLQKVDQSRDSNTAAQFVCDDRRTQSDIHKATVSDRSPSFPQYNQPSAQGFGLQLAPPSQRQTPTANQVMPCKASSHDSSAIELDEEAVSNKWSDTTVSAQSLLPASETCHRGNSDNFNVSGQADKETSQSCTPFNPSSTAASIHSLENQQQQSFSHATRDGSMHQSANISSDLGAQAKHASHLGPTDGSYLGTFNDQDVQASMSNAAGKTLPLRIPSSHDTHAPVFSHLSSPHSGLSQPTSAGFSHLRSSGQHGHQSEAKPASQPLIPGMPKQAGFSSMLHNVWKNVSAQRILGVLPQKFTSNIPHQSMVPSTSGGDAKSWTPQKADHQHNTKGSSPSGSATCSGNSQEVSRGDPVSDTCSPQIGKADGPSKVSDALHDQDPAAKHLSDANPALPISSLVRLHQQEISRAKLTQNTSHDLQTDVSFQKAGSFNIGNTQKPLDIRQQNYSLLQQMQAMKSVDSDLDKRFGKRINGADMGSAQLDGKASHMFTFGQNEVSRGSADKELGMHAHSPLQTNVKMLHLPSKDDRNPSTSSHAFGREASQETHASGRQNLYNYSSNLSSKPALMGGSEHPCISPQMAPSWFDRYGKTAETANQQHFFSKVSKGMENNLLNLRSDTSHLTNLVGSTSIADDNEMVPCYPNQSIVLRLKKRKCLMKPLAWHREVSQGPQRRQDISLAEVDWSQASNRLIEKAEDEVEMMEDGPSIPRPRKRLILTTQLTQVLLPPAPAAVLAAKANSSYESVTYFVARSALGDSCSAISCSDICSSTCVHGRNRWHGKSKTSEKGGEHIFSETVGGFVERSSKLENAFSRLEKRSSILDLRVECQDLERFTIINRLGKFHGRSQSDGVEISSGLDSNPRRLFPERYVTALPMRGDHPEGVLCLSL
ncbi:hypothetical protein DsansV1_C26g0191151 [Dioscorea sansibarensis]